MPIIPNSTVSSVVNLVNRALPVVKPPLSNSQVKLETSGVAGFFGGESAVRAMATVYLIPQRRWLGWYNAPGAYEVARQYSGIGKSHLFNALFPGGDSNPAKILMVDGQVGPEYTSLYSFNGKPPSSIGHLGSLIARKVSQKLELDNSKRSVDAWVTCVKLMRIPGDSAKLNLSESSSNIFTVITILFSVGGCIACALVADWFCFASIALGMIANGVACFAIGSGRLILKSNASAEEASPGGILLKSDTRITLLIGKEGMVRPFTHGRFVVTFGDTSSEKSWDGKSQSLVSSILQKYLTIDVSVLLLLSQFLGQLLLIPQGSLFGQIMFIGTLVPSWMYHSYLSTLGLDLQTQALCQKLSIEAEDIFQYPLDTWTQAAVFACLVFRSSHPPKWLSSTGTLPGKSPEDAQVEAMKKEEKRKNEEALGKRMNAESYAKEMAEETSKKETSHQDAEVKREAAKMEATNKTSAAQAATAVQQKADIDFDMAKTVADMKVEDAKAQDDRAKLEGDAERKVTAEREAEMKAEEAKEAQKEVLKMKMNALKAKKEVLDANIAADEAKKAEKEATDAADAAKAAAKVAKDAQLAAELVAFQAVMDEMENVAEQKEEAMKKQKDNERAQQKEEADKALCVLLDALLPDQTDAWKAFKESLVRKLSDARNNQRWSYMENDATFGFNDTEDITVHNGIQKLQGTKLDQLLEYQGEAERAFTEWKRLALRFN